MNQINTLKTAILIPNKVNIDRYNPYKQQVFGNFNYFVKSVKWFRDQNTQEPLLKNDDRWLKTDAQPS